MQIQKPSDQKRILHRVTTSNYNIDKVVSAVQDSFRAQSSGSVRWDG